MEKKLFLLDSYALIYRAYYSFAQNHRYNSAGLNTSAQYGFTNTLLEVIQKQQPTHIAAVFDSPGAVDSREAIFAAYKANREATPEDIKAAMPYIERIVEAFNIPVIKLGGYEADDIIGTLAKQAEKQGFTTYMMTPDKDYGQLVSEHTFMYKPGRFGKPAEVWGIPEVCEKFEVERPEQVIDILGLWGDAVDNIPGIPGVGEKTAKKLIAEYGTLENVLAHAHEIKGSLGERISTHKEQGLISKQLATIILDVPVELNEAALRLENPDKEKLSALFSELEFRNLSQRILGEPINTPSTQAPKSPGQLSMFDAPAQPKEPQQNQVLELDVVPQNFKTIADVHHQYQLVESPLEWEQLIQELSNSTSFCFDTETTSLNIQEAKLLGLAFSTKAHHAYYAPINETTLEHLTQLKPILEDPTKEKIAQNLKYDMSMLKKYNIEVAPPYFDTMIAHYLLRPDLKHSMDVLAETYLGYRPVSIETLIGKKGKNQGNMADVDIDVVKEYAAEDADITYQLKQVFAPMLAQNQLNTLFTDIEMPLIPVLSSMELAGINIDTKALASYSLVLEKQLNQLELDIRDKAGISFNLDSPKQLGEVLFEHLKILEKPKKTKTGQYATGEDVLETLKDAHPIVEDILAYRGLRKLKNTYVDTLPAQADPSTKRIHTSFMQTIAATGRLSSVNPNLQNIPIKTEQGRMVRKAFIARDAGHVLVAADYSQIELRIIAALSKDPNMLQAFTNKEDIHSATASKVFGVPISEVTREMRSKAKAVNFGILYGQTPFGLSKSIGISRKEATEIIDNYFKQYPGISAYIHDTQEQAKKLGYVQTILGRKRYLTDINSANAVVRGHAERNAINAPIQGSAADIIKIAMIQIQNELQKRKLQSQLLLQVHDELVFDVPKNEVEELKTLVKSLMEQAVTLEVPLEVEVGVGQNWLEAH